MQREPQPILRIPLSKFRSLTSELKSCFEVEQYVPSSRAPLDDILRVLTFHGDKGKKLKKKTTPTTQYILSGTTEHRKA